jgi:hypothetical protein
VFIDSTYAVDVQREVWRAFALQESFLLVVFAGFAGKYHQKL